MENPHLGLAEGREERELPNLLSQHCVIKGRWGIARRKRTAEKGGEMGGREPGSGPLTSTRMLTFIHIQKKKSMKRHLMEGQKSAFESKIFCLHVFFVVVQRNCCWDI